jgi:hypothetical protein
VTNAAGADVGDKFANAGATRTVVYDATAAKYYELVTLVTPISWTDAKTAAEAAGGLLASPSTEAKMTFVKQAYTNADLPDRGAADGTNGAWIGAQQADNSPSPGEGWAFLDGSPLPANSPLWNTAGGAVEPNDGDSVENNAENFAALFYGTTLAAPTDPLDLKIIYDAGSGGTATQPKYLIQYDTKAAIQ